MFQVRAYNKKMDFKTTIFEVATEEEARRFFNDEEKLAKAQEDIFPVEGFTLEKMTYLVIETKDSNMKKYTYEFDTLQESDKKIDYLKFKRPHGASMIKRYKHHEIIEKKEMVKH